jgi:crotonobetainyl-CoA:carnitine CoA-transferase CaiB-like acyl-CoA transferase
MLDGVRVLDATRLMPFSYTTHLLHAAGAEVVKVEAPGGEVGRGMPRAFDLLNRGKRSITLDLRTAPGREALLGLVADFDVFVESFRPGYLDSLGLGFDDLVARRPGLVHCSATGWGETGPFRGRAGHDVNYQALAGCLSPDGGQPVVAPVPYIDMGAGLSAAFAVAAALVATRAGGDAIHLDVGMADLALSFNALALAETAGAAEMVGGDSAAGPLAGYPWPDLMLEQTPCYGTFATQDGRFLSLANVEPKFWSAFLACVDLPDLADARFATGPAGAAVRARIAEAIAAKPLAYWDATFMAADVCYAPVLTAAEAYAHPQLHDRAVDGAAMSTPRLGLPLRTSPPRPAAPAERVPAPGEDDAALSVAADQDVV